MSKRKNRQTARRQARRRLKDSPIKQIGTRKMMNIHYGDGPSRPHAAERKTNAEAAVLGDIDPMVVDEIISDILGE